MNNIIIISIIIVAYSVYHASPSHVQHTAGDPRSPAPRSVLNPSPSESIRVHPSPSESI